MNKLQFYPVAPVSWLQRMPVEKDSKPHHMVLAQELINCKEYKNWYVRAGCDNVILDNGAYEDDQVKEAPLVALCKELRPKVVVAPDVPHHSLATVSKSLRFVSRLKDSMSTPPEVMTVLHADEGNLSRFLLMYETACQLGSWVGFSRLTRRYDSNTSLGIMGRRAEFAMLLQREGLWQFGKTHHALGMLDGNLKELHLLKVAKFDSIDSTAPIWRGLHGFSLHEHWSDYNFTAQQIDFPEVNYKQASHNLNEVVEACQ